MDKDFMKCMEIVKRWEETLPVEIKKANTAAEDFRDAAVETLSITALIVLVWTLITLYLYF